MYNIITEFRARVIKFNSIITTQKIVSLSAINIIITFTSMNKVIAHFSI